MARRRRGFKSPDYLLDKRGLREVNQRFYASEPADYFLERIRSVFLAAVPPAERAALLHERKLDDITYRVQPNDLGAMPKTASHFITTEVEVLSHHIGETLLRLYLGHRGHPSCPALEVARITNPQLFKEMVRRRFVDQPPPRKGHRREIAATLYGVRRRPAEVAPQVWVERLDAIEDYLRHFARQFLDEAVMYNAAKHGMGLTPGQVTAELSGTPVKAEGRAIIYVRSTQIGGRARWANVIHWVKADQQIALMWAAHELMRTLWQVARYRYVGPKDGKQRVQLFTFIPYGELMGIGTSPGFNLQDMTVSLPYWTLRKS